MLTKQLQSDVYKMMMVVSRIKNLEWPVNTLKSCVELDIEMPVPRAMFLQVEIKEQRALERKKLREKRMEAARVLREQQDAEDADDETDEDGKKKKGANKAMKKAGAKGKSKPGKRKGGDLDDDDDAMDEDDDEQPAKKSMKVAAGAKAKAKGAGAKAKAKAGGKDKDGKGGKNGKNGKPEDDDDFDERAADIDAICEKYPRCSREKAAELRDNFFNTIYARGQDHYFSEDSDITDIISDDEAEFDLMPIMTERHPDSVEEMKMLDEKLHYPGFERRVRTVDQELKDYYAKLRSSGVPEDTLDSLLKYKMRHPDKKGGEIRYRNMSLAMVSLFVF